MYIKNTRKNKIIIVVFTVMLLAPILTFIFNFDFIDRSQENRQLANKPPLPTSFDKIDEFINGLESYYNDNFGLRGELVVLDSFIDTKILPKDENSRLLFGEEEWLFFQPTLKDYKNTDTFSDAELKTWVDILTKRNDYLEQKGIKYYLVIAPNKINIYPENLSEDYFKVEEYNRLEQLDMALNKTNIQFINLTQEILDNKDKGQLYHKGDAHWNDTGAFIGYSKISEVITQDFPNYITLSEDDFEKTEETLPSELESLYNMLLLGEYYSESTIKFNYKNPLAENTKTEVIAKQNRLLIFETPHIESPRAIIFRDSFADAVIPYFQESFSESIFYWSQLGFNSELVEKHNPDIVIQLFVERRLHEAIPNQP